MLDKVESWTPPTSEHEGLKQFMHEQLTSSIRFDCGSDDTPPPTPLTPDAWLAREVQRLERSIAYHTKEHAEEVSRTSGRNQWLADLRESLK